jgi:ribosome-binding factor A
VAPVVEPRMSHRQARVAHELRDRIAQIVEQRVSDPRLSDVTISAVKVSPDLSFARVFFYTHGDAEQATRAFARAKPFIRRWLGTGLRLRRVPDLDFRQDDSLDSGARIDEILKELRNEKEPA